MVELSVAKRTVGISNKLLSGVVCKTFCGELDLARAGDFGPQILTVTGFVINAQPARARIDSMYVGPPFLTPSSGFESFVSHVAKSSSDFHFEGITMIEVGNTSISFGHNMLVRSTTIRYAEDGMTERLPFDITIGTTLHQIADFYFDFKAKHLWLKPAL